MRTVGLIVEYNPLHNGHLHHFREARAATGADAAICVMSGHFLQRGEPAIIGKWARAEAALSMGADLVIELPVRYSSAPAEWFAYGAVCLLDRTRVVDTLCFGSESGDLYALSRLARELAREPESFRLLLKQELKSGKSYPSAYEAACRKLFGETADFGKPNNNLGFHYLIALHRLSSRIVPFTIPRIKADYHQTSISDGRIASATAIRKLILGGGPDAAKGYVPDYVLDILRREFGEGRGPVTWESFAGLLLYRLSTADAGKLALCDEVDEGLENRILSALSAMRDGPFSVERLIGELKTKRYTRTKLQRMLARILLEQPKTAYERSVMEQGPGFIRVLGFNARGRELLKRIKRESPLPVITRVGQREAALLEEELKATAVYALAHREKQTWQIRRDFYQEPIRMDSTD